MEITLKTEYNVVKIYFGEFLHLRFHLPSLIGFQSWSCANGKWVIKYTFVGGTISSEYDNVDKWKTVLGLLDKEL